MSPANNGQKIFPQAKDYKVFLEQLREGRRRYPFNPYAYVLMRNGSLTSPKELVIVFCDAAVFRGEIV